jgi:hypothetical protein
MKGVCVDIEKKKWQNYKRLTGQQQIKIQHTLQKLEME